MQSLPRFASYLRVSTEDQQDRGTIQNQAEFSAKYTDLHQINLVDWYKNDGITGTIPLEQRPQGQRLLQDANAGKIDTLLHNRFDRLGLSVRNILTTIHEFEEGKGVNN